MLVRGISHLLYVAVFIFLICLLVRMVFDWAQVFKRDWEPKGILLVVASAVYRVTDWPLKQLRKVIPPVRVGDVGLDVGFTLLTFVCVFLMGILR